LWLLAGVVAHSGVEAEEALVDLEPELVFL
jgi:hypothetical protein